MTPDDARTLLPSFVNSCKIEVVLEICVYLRQCDDPYFAMSIKDVAAFPSPDDQCANSVVDVWLQVAVEIVRLLGRSELHHKAALCLKPAARFVEILSAIRMRNANGSSIVFVAHVIFFQIIIGQPFNRRWLAVFSRRWLTRDQRQPLLKFRAA